MTSNAPLLDAVGSELSALLSPITLATFVREYWAKKPLYVKGFPDKYKGLFSREVFVRALSAPGPAPEDFLHASFDKGKGSTASKAADEWASSTFKANPEEAMPLFKAGATLCVTLMETRVPALAPIVGAIKRQLGYPGNVHFNAYLSSGRRIQLALRWTDREHSANRRDQAVAVLQSTGRALASVERGPSGRRDRSVHRPPRSAARVHRFLAGGEEYRGIPFDENDTTEVVLEPGNLLILPAGVWHDACAGDGGSLALNLSFSPISYTLLARNLLDALLTPDPAWRAPPPLLPLPGGAPGEVDPAGSRRSKLSSRPLPTRSARSPGTARQSSDFGGHSSRTRTPASRRSRRRLPDQGQIIQTSVASHSIQKREA